MADENIITLTDAAITRAKKILQQKPAGSILHIAVTDAGCTGKKYVVDVLAQPSANDKDIKVSGDLIIYIDKNSLDLISGSVLDCEEKNLGTWQWVFHNPKAKSNCGCGESFSVEDK